jgi:hypothetical protein
MAEVGLGAGREWMTGIPSVGNPARAGVALSVWSAKELREQQMKAIIATLSLTPLMLAQSGPWFGTPLPPGLSDPWKPVMDYTTGFEPLPAEFPHRPGKHDELLDGTALRKDLRTIIGFSRESYDSGEKLWGRRATTPAFHHAMEWAAAELKAAGLNDARVEKFPVPGTMWVAKSWRVQLNGDPAFGAGTQNLTLQSAYPQNGGASTPPGGLTAPLIFVGRGTPADLVGRDLKGKIAVVHVRPEPGLFGAAETGTSTQLTKLGAVAVISAIEGPGNMQYFDGRFACGTAPCFMIGGNDAWFLEQVYGKAAAEMPDKLKATLTLETEQKGGLVSANAFATIPGSGPGRIIINAHVDGQFQAADDNGSGFATLMALARYFAKQPQPRHTLMFVASGGHHGPGNGPASLVVAHPELKDGTALVINLEHVAYSDSVRGQQRAKDNFGVTWNTSVTESAKVAGVTNLAPYMVDVWRQAPRCFGVVIYQQILNIVPGDPGGYRPLNVPMTQMIQAGSFYHTSGDVFEQVPAEGMERAARFHAFMIEAADRADDALLKGAQGSLGNPSCASILNRN